MKQFGQSVDTVFVDEAYRSMPLSLWFFVAMTLCMGWSFSSSDANLIKDPLKIYLISLDDHGLHNAMDLAVKDNPRKNTPHEIDLRQRTNYGAVMSLYFGRIVTPHNAISEKQYPSMLNAMIFAEPKRYYHFDAFRLLGVRPISRMILG